MTERFIKGYCCGDVGLVDKEKEEWFVENINSISDSERNWNDVLDKLNEVAQENEQLKKDATTLIYANQDYRKENEQLKNDCSNLIDDNTEYVAEINQMHKENEQLKQNCKNYEWYKQYKAVLNENEKLKVDKQALIDFIKKEFPKSHKHILEGFE